MRITLDLPPWLVWRARRMAQRDDTTLSVLVEGMLQRVLAEHEPPRARPVRLVTCGGDGLAPDLEGAPWSEVLTRSYESKRT